MTERTNNLSYILADLQVKTKNAEEERDRSTVYSNVIVKDNAPLNCNPASEPGNNEADDCTIEPRDVLIPNIKVSNSFSALAIEENNTGKATSKDTRQNQTHEKKKKNRVSSNQRKSNLQMWQTSKM